MSGPAGRPLDARASDGGRRWRGWVRVTLLLAPTVFFLLGAELAVRLGRGVGLSPANTRARTLWLIRSAYPAEHDPRLGYVPRRGYRGDDNIWNTQVTIGSDSLRSNGRQAPLPGPCVLAVGDSYTFGDEVSDEDTWPARLEVHLGRPVLNGGVFGYGLDQIELRTEQLLESHPCVDTLVVGLIPDDVSRCEYSYRFAWKPYFELSGRGLALRNVPVPREPPERTRDQLLHVLGFSHLVDAIMRRTAPQLWLRGGLEARRVHEDGEEVAVRLVRRLHDLARERGLRLAFLVQGHPALDFAPLRRPVEEAHALQIPVLNAEELLRRTFADDQRGLRAHYGSGHLSARGNDWTASRLAPLLEAAFAPP